MDRKARRVQDIDKSYRDGYIDGWLAAVTAWKRLCQKMHWSTALYVLRTYWQDKLRPWGEEDVAENKVTFPPRLEP